MRASLQPAIENIIDLHEENLELGTSMLEVGCPPLELVREGSPQPHPLTVRDAFFQIGREAIANAIRQSKAAHNVLKLKYWRNRVTVEICDDSVVFSLANCEESLAVEDLREARVIVDIVRSRIMELRHAEKLPPCGPTCGACAAGNPSAGGTG